MRLYLSEQAAKQLHGDNKKNNAPVLTPEQLEREAARHAKRQAKLEAKALKAQVREQAAAAEDRVRQALEAVEASSESIAKAERRLEKDRDDHAKLVSRALNRLTELQKKLERLHDEMREAQLELDQTRLNVPPSIAGMDQLKEDRRSKLNVLRQVFAEAEEAFNHPSLTKSQKRKRDSSLRRNVKNLIEG